MPLRWGLLPAITAASAGTAAVRYVTETTAENAEDAEVLTGQRVDRHEPAILNERPR